MRSRNIKPGFFKNEHLAELSAADRLLFIGLWCLADREGRLEDRPKRIKMELMPMDNYDASSGLDGLEHGGFITRYVIEGKGIIEIGSFCKHQSPHGTEKDSELPDSNGMLTANERGKNGQVTGHKRLINVKERESEVNKRPDSLIPDSLIPDSPKPVVAPAKPSSRQRPMPDDFTASPAVLKWAAEQGYSSAYVGSNLTTFVLSAQAKGYKYANWDKALMNAIKGNWAKASNGEASKHNGFDSVDYRKGVSDDGSF